MVDKLSNVQIFVESLTVIIITRTACPSFPSRWQAHFLHFWERVERAGIWGEWFIFSLPDSTMKAFQAQQPEHGAPGSELESNEALGWSLIQQQRANRELSAYRPRSTDPSQWGELRVSTLSCARQPSEQQPSTSLLRHLLSSWLWLSSEPAQRNWCSGDECSGVLRWGRGLETGEQRPNLGYRGKLLLLKRLGIT